MSTSTVIVLVVIGILIIWAIGVYNSLISMRQRVNQAYADIDVQLRQRHDMGGGATNCGFATFQQCMAAVSGVGGSCSPSPY